MSAGPLVDGFGRVHTSSADQRYRPLQHSLLLLHAGGERAVQAAARDPQLRGDRAVHARRGARLGVNKLRLTGGEPLVRHDLRSPGRATRPKCRASSTMALTTNGILLAEQAQALRHGRPAPAEHQPRRPGCRDVSPSFRGATVSSRCWRGFPRPSAVGFERIKLNAVAIRGITGAGDRAARPGLPANTASSCGSSSSCRSTPKGNWKTLRSSRARKSAACSSMRIGAARTACRSSTPASRRPTIGLPTARAIVGFINPVTQPFCGDCNRLRLTAEGQVRNCLFSTVEWDARARVAQRRLRRAAGRSGASCVGGQKGRPRHQ